MVKLDKMKRKVSPSMLLDNFISKDPSSKTEKVARAKQAI